MDIAIIVCTPDPAGMNVKQHLLKKGFIKLDESFQDDNVYELDTNDSRTRLFTVKDFSIYNENIDKDIKGDNFSPELIIFATTHKSASGIHSLSVHAPGNWDIAELGGTDNKLCIAPARLLKFSLLHLEQLNEERELNYEIIQECTHHGPYTEVPTMFIEIGSDETSWNDQEAGNTIADTIIYMMENINNIPEYKVAFGIGGLHHTPSFYNVMKRTDFCFGHVCPKYMLTKLTKEKVQQAIKQTKEKVDLIVLDWKGLATEKERIKTILEELQLPYDKSHNLK